MELDGMVADLEGVGDGLGNSSGNFIDDDFGWLTYWINHEFVRRIVNDANAGSTAAKLNSSSPREPRMKKMFPLEIEIRLR